MTKVINPVQGAKLFAYLAGGDIMQFFGEHPELYGTATNGSISYHNGVDLNRKPEGHSILATAGVVCEVKDSPQGYGEHIRILTDPDANGDFLELTYGHLQHGSIKVKVGDVVKDGDIIAGLGNTGFVISGGTPYWGTAPAGRGLHLHFGVRVCSNKYSVDATPVRYSSGMEARIKNYYNDINGAVDPMPYLEITILTQIRDIALNVIELLKKVAQNRNKLK